ncbi:MAG: type II secretion system F family protein [Bradymonadia bacterium]
MNVLVIMAGLTLFCLLQAGYWLVVWRRGSRRVAIAERLGTLQTEDDGDQSGLLRTGVDDDTFFDQLSFSKGLKESLEQAGEDVSLTAFFSRCMAFMLGGFAFFALVTANVAASFFMGLAFGFVPYLLLMRKRRLRIGRIEEQLPEALEMMTISLRAGHSLAQTIRLTADELQPPLQEEFRRVAEEQALGRGIDEALVAMSKRLQEARTMRTFVVSVMVLRQTGGNLIEVLESIIDTMRQQGQYARKLNAMTAEGRSSARTLALLPPGFATMAYLAGPDYIGNLINDSLGRTMLIIAVALWILGVTWVRRLVKPRT